MKQKVETMLKTKPLIIVLLALALFSSITLADNLVDTGNLGIVINSLTAIDVYEGQASINESDADLNFVMATFTDANNTDTKYFLIENEGNVDVDIDVNTSLATSSILDGTHSNIEYRCVSPGTWGETGF